MRAVTAAGLFGAVLGVGALALFARAQQPPNRIVRQPVGGVTGSGGPVRAQGILIEPTAPVMNLFSRAQEGIDRRDWKFGIDSLQRIIDDPQGSLLPSRQSAEEAFILYESARRRAVRQIASLPPGGLAAYRLLHDGTAKGLLERAKRNHDIALLRTVADRFLLTRYGDDAADLLASWLLDTGQFGEVVSVLTDLQEFVPDSDVPDTIVVAKLAVARAALGQASSAETLIEGFRQRSGEMAPPWLDRLAVSAVLAAAHEASPVSTQRPYEPGAWSWPLWGGSLTRQGRMPPISPTLLESVPWSYRLTGRASDVWDRVHDAATGDALELPAPSFVVDHDRLIIREPDRCTALDIEDLTPIWWFPRTAGDYVAPSAGIPRGGRSFSNRLFDDYTAGSLSVGHGLVLFVEPSGVGKVPPESAATAASLDRAFASRIIALDAVTGEQVWERGRTGDVEDPLGSVSFRAAPVPVGDKLWVAVVDHRDLYMAVLDPTDGSLLDMVSLCAMPSGGPARDLSSELAVADGLVYLPTEFGVLFAMDAGDRSVHWAMRYGDGPDRPTALARVHRGMAVGARQGDVDADSEGLGVWLTSPPIVAGGLVLLAPTDHAALMAFSAAFGTHAWSSEVAGTSYLIGADEHHVWLGGRSIACVSLVDGSAVWSHTLEGAPSGRAVLSGNEVHVPTADGLVTLSAKEGSVTARQILTEVEAPLGNLMCTDAAMFSIEPSSVRKYPDTGRPYLAALEAYEAASSDVTAALRLGWLQHLRGESAAALATLSTIDEANLRADARRAGAVAHLRVGALMALAEKDDTDTAIARLAEARDIALTPPDRVRSSMALADRLSAAGQHFEAYCFLLNTGFEPEAQHRVLLDKHVTASARLQIARRLEQTSQQLTSRELEQITADVRSRVEASVAELVTGDSTTASRAFLSAVAELPAPASVRVQSLTALADWEVSRSGYERAEQLLLQGLELADEPVLEAGVLIRLANLALQPTQNRESALLGHLRALDRAQLAGLEVPPESPLAPFGNGASTVGAWVAATRLRLEAKPDQGAAVAAKGGAVGIQFGGPIAWKVEAANRTRNQQQLLGGVQVTQQGNPVAAPFAVPDEIRNAFAGDPGRGPRLIDVRVRGGEVPGDRAFFHAPDDVIYCQRSSDGALLWHTTLSLPESFDAVSGARMNADSSGRRTAVMDGQIVVLNGRLGLFAVGAQTGRRLWFKPYEYITPYNETNVRDSLMVADRGMLAAMPREGHLTLMRMRDGAELWERDLRGGNIARLLMTDHEVVAIDREYRRVRLFDRDTGSLISSVAFEQPSDTTGPVNIVPIGSMLVGPSATGGANDDDPGVAAYDVDTGARLWRTGFVKPVVQVFHAGLDYLGVGLLGGDLVVLAATTGEIAFTRRVEGVSAVVDGRVVDTNLVVQAYGPNERGLALELVAMDIATGNPVWRRDDVAGLVEFDKAVPGVQLPVLVKLGGTRGAGQQLLGAAIIDLRTGVNVGDTAHLGTPTDTFHRYNGDYGLYDGAFLVGFTDAVQAYATEPVLPESREDL